jgi:Asp-tRNA(Asn)/Glu-tRNA(Gln) amidotransferase A subunit family amidase
VDPSRPRVALLPSDPRWPVHDSVADACRRAFAALVARGMTGVEWSWSWLAEARDLTLRDWQRSAGSGGDVAGQLWDWDRFRRRSC